MIELADGFVVLSGGIGTWEEFFEVLVGRLLGEHSGPIGLLRDGPMNEALLELIERGTTLGLVRPVTQELVQVHEDPNAAGRHASQPCQCRRRRRPPPRGRD